MAKYGGLNRIKQLEEAAGIAEPSPLGPVTPPPSQGFVAAPYLGPRPWRGEVVPPPAPAPRTPSLASRAAQYLPSSWKAIDVGRGLVGKATDYLAGKDIFNRSMPRATGETRGMLSSTPTVQSSPLIPLDTLRRRSTRGSAPFSDAELKQGYRKMGKGMKK
jgi:hypothetical protein